MRKIPSQKSCPYFYYSFYFQLFVIFAEFMSVAKSSTFSCEVQEEGRVLPKDLIENIAAADRGGETISILPETLYKKLRQSWTVFLLKWGGKELSLRLHLIVWNFFPVFFFFFKSCDLSCQKSFPQVLVAFIFTPHHSKILPTALQPHTTLNAEVMLLLLEPGSVLVIYRLSIWL